MKYKKCSRQTATEIYITYKGKISIVRTENARTHQTHSHVIDYTHMKSCTITDCQGVGRRHKGRDEVPNAAYD